LFNNRASCLQRIGDYKSCIIDCDFGIELIAEISPNELKNESVYIKLLNKKANSLELLEKYTESLDVYKKIIKIDWNFPNAQQSYNRLKSIVKDDLSSLSTRTCNTIIKTNSNLYEEYKLKGNDYVKRADYKTALDFYTKCIDLDSVKLAAYLNRSLCYLKLNKPDLAIKDSTFVLVSEPNNVKALYRRACSNKKKRNYDLAVEDLKLLLKIEPNNKLAIEEYNLINKELNSRNVEGLKKVPVTDSKQLTKVFPKNEKEIDRKEPTTIEINEQIVKFSKITNGYEFLQNWNSIKPNDITSYACLLASISPHDLPKFIGTKLDDDMLSKLLNSFHLLTFSTNNKIDRKCDIVEYLEALTNVKRFNVIKLFISNFQKKLLNDIFKDNDSRINIEILKKKYDL
jgi:tetratricopeptide (TPR) repeat protein